MPKKPSTDETTRPIFSKGDELFDDSLQKELAEQKSKPVECLGRTFPNDAARREYYLARLKEHLEDPEFRKTPGFPRGTDEDILKLSDPPYYTACPNPFLGDFMQTHGKPYDPSSNYKREPFAADVSEGKNDPVYDAHSYHTKVPPKAILRYILHYTDPGDVVLDGFAGTGMTAIAAQLAALPRLVAEVVGAHGGDGAGQDADSKIAVGPRHAIASDLAPIGGFITRNILTAARASELIREAEAIVADVEQAFGWLYAVKDASNCDEGKLVYAVWTDILRCSECGAEIDAFDAVVDLPGHQMLKEFPCPSCRADLKRRTLDKVMVTTYDPVLRTTVTQPKQLLKQLYFKVGKTRHERLATANDLSAVRRAERELEQHRVPTQSMDHTWQHIRDGNHIKNITHTHHYFTPRNLLALTALRERIERSRFPSEMLFVLTGFIDGHANKRNRFIVDRHHPEGTTCGPLSNTLFLPEVQCEVNVFDKWRQTVRKQSKAWALQLSGRVLIQTRSATCLGLPDKSIDYIFVDPPFGKNIMYSDLNHLYEVWLGVLGNPANEAIVNERQRKGLAEYSELMARSFAEFYRVLKPGRWMTLEFHNSLNSVWAALQEALFRAGFVVADVRVLDKKHGTIHQDSGYTVKQDLIVSAYRPNGGLEERFRLEAGTAEGVWDFVRTHLRQLPVFVAQGGRAEVVAERQRYLLFDRMVAFHVQRGVTVPLSSAEFHQGLGQRFAERDGMFFLPDQVAQYDRRRLSVRDVMQLELFVKDEASAIKWLQQELLQKPLVFSEVHPRFLKEIGGWQKHEKPLELLALLEENCLKYDGIGEVPSQIHSYLSSNYKELRNKSKEDPELKMKAKDRWYVPDPKKAGDLEKLRERALLKEFEEYRASNAKQLRVFRVEAMRAGFKAAYDRKDYRMIVEVAEKLPETVLQEDEKLLMYYDVASMRLGDREGKSELF